MNKHSDGCSGGSGEIKYFDVGNKSCVSFGWYSFCSEKIVSHLNCSQLSKILFYQCRFQDVDFSELNKLNVEQMSFHHCELDSRSEISLIAIGGLRFIKILDTDLSQEAIDHVLTKTPKIELVNVASKNT